MKFGRGLECIVHCDKKRGLPDGGQDLSLGLCVLCRLSFLHDGGLFEYFHGKELTSIKSSLFTGQENLAIGPSA